MLKSEDFQGYVFSNNKIDWLSIFMIFVVIGLPAVVLGAHLFKLTDSIIKLSDFTNNHPQISCLVLLAYTMMFLYLLSGCIRAILSGSNSEYKSRNN